MREFFSHTWPFYWLCGRIFTRLDQSLRFMQLSQVPGNESQHGILIASSISFDMATTTLLLSPATSVLTWQPQRYSYRQQHQFWQGNHTIFLSPAASVLTWQPHLSPAVSVLSYGNHTLFLSSATCDHTLFLSSATSVLTWQPHRYSYRQQHLFWHGSRKQAQ